MRTSTLGFVLGFSAFGLGCGDDSTQTPVDGRVVADAAVDAPKAMFKGFNADEGGEVRLEYVTFAAGNAATRATSFLFKDSGSTKFHPIAMPGGCTNITPGATPKYWPTAVNPQAERVYHDMGDVIISGGPQVLVIPRRPAGRDPSFRDHPADAWRFHFGGAAATDGATYISEKKGHDVTFTGSADFPAQVFDNVLYMPAAYALTENGVAVSPPYAPTPLVAGQAKTFTWEVVNSAPPTGYEINSLVAFTGANGPVVLCLEPNDGSITVPAAFVDIVRAAYPSGGVMARQTLTHVVRELVDNNGPTGKRIDFLAVWCYATPFTSP